MVVSLLTGCSGGGGSGSESSTPPIANNSSSSVSSTTIDLIPNLALHTLITQKLSLPNDTKLDAATLEKLTALDTQNVDSLEGLQYAKNLVVLSANGNFPDISPIVHLNQLSELHISTRQPIEFHLLKSLPNLKTLGIWGFQNPDLSPIKELTQLNKLFLGYNLLQTIPDLSTLTSLQELDLRFNSITDLTPISKLKNITSLNLTANPIDSLEALRGNAPYSLINLSETLITDFEPLMVSAPTTGSSQIKMNTSCFANSENSIPYQQILQLRSLGYAFETPQTDQQKILADTGVACGIVKNANFVISAVANTPKSASLNWNLSGWPNSQLGACELFFNPSKVLPIQASMKIENCSQIGNQIISNLTYLPSTILIRFTDGYSHTIESRATVSGTGFSNGVAQISKIEWGQTVVKENLTLVPNKAALLRVFVTFDLGSQIPTLNITATNADTSLDLTLQNQLFLEDSIASPNKLTTLYTAIVPKELINSTLSLSVSLNNQKLNPIQPTISKASDFYLMIVPTSIAGTITDSSSLSSLESAIKELLPIGTVHFRKHSTVEITTHSTAQDVYQQIVDLHKIEGDPIYYMGFYPGGMYSDASGYGDIRGKTSVVAADIWEYTTAVHELGHNFGRKHVNCGGAKDFIDNHYPYEAYGIGTTIGVNLDFSQFFYSKKSAVDSIGYSDVMSYCLPKAISDYNYQAIQNFIELLPPVDSTASSKSQKTNLAEFKYYYISGTINQNLNVSINQFVATQNAFEEKTSSQLVVKVKYKNGSQLERNAVVPEIDHAKTDMPTYFNLNIPYGDIATINIIYQGRNIYTYNFNTPNISKKMNLSSSPSEPIVINKNEKFCLTWIPVGNESASWFVNSNGKTQVITLNNLSGTTCVNTKEVPGSGQWQINIGSGLSTKTYLQSY